MNIDRLRKYRRFNLFVLAYTLLVILWGAWVRISRSGDGCGDSWPLCRDQVLPVGSSLPTWIEFSHRLSSGLFLILIVALVVFTMKTFPRGHWLKKWVWLIAFFTVTEALVGAALVLQGLTGDNTSIMRAYVMGAHMVNSLALTGSIAIAWIGSPGDWVARQTHSKFQKLAPLLILGLLFISCTGAIAALAGTLFPSDSLWEGVLKDFSQNSHVLVKLRIWHPLAASLVGGLLFFFGLNAYFDAEDDERKLKRAALLFILVLAGGITFGYATLLMLSPVWMKLTHLLLAHIIWIALLNLLWRVHLCVRWGIY